MTGLFRAIIVLAGLAGSSGVALAAIAAHAADAANLAPAAMLLLVHALAALAAVALTERQLLAAAPGIAAGFGFVLGAALFAGDISLRRFAGHGLFPMAAPTGGIVLILSWLVLAAAAIWPR